MNCFSYKSMLRAMVASASCLMLVGCSSAERSPFERFERLPTVQQLVTVDLGEFVVPVPIEVKSSASMVSARQVQIEFGLHAAVLPEHERTLQSNHERLEGRFRDTVIDVCRNTPVEDLLDPDLTTLKAHLADSMKPFIGDAHIERIHVVDAEINRL